MTMPATAPSVRIIAVEMREGLVVIQPGRGGWTVTKVIGGHLFTLHHDGFFRPAIPAADGGAKSSGSSAG